MFYSKPITGLTIYMRWKRLFLFVRFNILNDQPECDRRCAGSQPNRKTGILRAFTKIAQKPRGRIRCTRSGICAKTMAQSEQAITETSNRYRPVTTSHQRSTGTRARRRHVSCERSLFVSWEPSDLMEGRFVMKTRIITTAFARSLFGVTRSVS